MRRRTVLQSLSTLFVVVLWAASAAAQPSALQQAPSRSWTAAIDEIDALVAQELARDGVGSVTIGVVSGPKLTWTKSYGMADTQAKRAATRESVYRVGSITKQFTALMLLQLVEQGKVHLTDPVEKYVPEFAGVRALFPGMPQATLVQLATMTSGLAREPDGAPDHSRGPVSGWQDKVFASMPFVKYAHEPDTRYLYSNIGYATLGMALSRAAGQPFTDWVQQRILSPLGMKHTAFDADAAMRPHLTRGYQVGDGKVDGDVALREHAGRGYRVPNGGLYSTVDDLARFVSWELGEGPSGILKKETQDANYARVNTANGDLTSGYGVGFMASRRGTLVALGHGGSTPGYRAAAHFHRRSKTGVIVLASVGGGKLNVGDVALRALEKLAALQEQPVADDTRSSGQVTAASAPAGGRVTGVISGAPEQQVALVKVALLSLTGAELDAVPRGTFVVDMRERVAVADRDESGKFQFQSVAPGLYGIGLTTKGSSSGDKVALAESRVRRRISMMTTEEKEVGTPAVFKLAAGETLDLGTLWPKQ